MSRKLKNLPLKTIQAATNGDEIALSAVVTHYQSYIRVLSTRLVTDACGNEFLYVDDSIRLRLEAKLMYCIIMNFEILPE